MNAKLVSIAVAAAVDVDVALDMAVDMAVDMDVDADVDMAVDVVVDVGVDVAVAVAVLLSVACSAGDRLALLESATLLIMDTKFDTNIVSWESCLASALLVGGCTVMVFCFLF